MPTNTWIIAIGLSSLSFVCATAEVEYEIHTGYNNTDFSTCFGPGPRKTISMLIELTDDKGKPIPNAIVVLKRMGPDGWPEEELRKEKNSVTDARGMILLSYPMPMHSAPSTNDKGEPQVPILGAVTVIAAGYPSSMIELRDHFKDGLHTTLPATSPILRLTLRGHQD